MDPGIWDGSPKPPAGEARDCSGKRAKSIVGCELLPVGDVAKPAAASGTILHLMPENCAPGSHPGSPQHLVPQNRGQKGSVKTFPLFFTYTNIVKTPAFHAVVTTTGRALLTHHEGESWVCSGIEPGGLDAEGEEAIDATKQFATEFQLVLEDMAGEAENFGAFELAVRRFFENQNRDGDRLWHNAVAAIQSGSTAVDPSLATLERAPRADSRGVEVALLTGVIPKAWNDGVTLAVGSGETG